ncbi:MAG: hypothetical protein ISN28_09960, partial [Ectothiorhodospiraceae bacterium AqS1]|nr:hypothetical protein [Ectothiorhodospiraceae bacterium AqS1]
MARRKRDAAAAARLLEESRAPLPASRKAYVDTAGGQRVPLRAIALSDGREVMVYDTSGPYSDPA